MIEFVIIAAALAMAFRRRKLPAAMLEGVLLAISHG
jgi:hypothetical protein